MAVKSVGLNGELQEFLQDVEFMSQLIIQKVGIYPELMKNDMGCVCVAIQEELHMD